MQLLGRGRGRQGRHRHTGLHRTQKGAHISQRDGCANGHRLARFTLKRPDGSEGMPDVIVPRDHDPGRLLGRTSSGTASVFETARGLEYWVDPPDTEEGRSLVVLVRRKDVRGSSFAFIPATVDWTEEETRILRTVRKVKALYDVSPVTNPAYPESTATMSRSADDVQAELKLWRQGGVAWRNALRERETQIAELGL